MYGGCPAAMNSGSVLEACILAQKASPPKCSLSYRMCSVQERATSQRLSPGDSLCAHQRKDAPHAVSSSSKGGFTCGRRECVNHLHPRVVEVRGTRYEVRTLLKVSMWVARCRELKLQSVRVQCGDASAQEHGKGFERTCRRMLAGHCISRVCGRGWTKRCACDIAMAAAADTAPCTVAPCSRHLQVELAIQLPSN